MTDKILVLDFTGTAGKEHESAVRYDFRKLAGTDGYCSEEASIVLKRKLGEFGYEGIHFLDSGNYHYLTKFFLDQIREPFDLAVFDNHTDMQPSALLPLLSCGNWLLETLKENSLVHRVCLIGPPGEAPAEVGEEERKKLCWITREEFRKGEAEKILANVCTGYPVYFSIDKDVLRREDARTNWDQGEMKLEELCGLLRFLGSRGKVLGADICGAEIPITLEGKSINSRTDERLVECIYKITIRGGNKDGIRERDTGRGCSKAGIFPCGAGKD